METSTLKQFITLRIPKGVVDIDWQYFSVYKERLNDKFMIEIDDLNLVELAKQNNIDFCWSYPATTYYELTQLRKLGAKEIIISGQLIFDKENLIASNFNNYRLIPNYALNIFPDDDGVCGSWIRPEVLKNWDNIVSSCYFKAKNLKQEKTLFEIYKEEKWEDDLSLIIDGLNVPLYGQYLGTSINTKRENCKQLCMKNNEKCNFCNRIKNLGYIIQDAVNQKIKEKENN